MSVCHHAFLHVNVIDLTIEVTYSKRGDTLGKIDFETTDFSLDSHSERALYTS
jgi:hypothetical protein